ncbi:hypothetical protein Vretifemale_11357 [Volvox reticuliferus]|uniref:Uncharacterized protein n=2 Tax=Volvox reticuliferus TaxID=1737510 RepID=A0A8J4CIV8_9CHLO|nr:hypothetical protein Vretifemale_11357 [Volvox reticuliferus]
MAGWNLRVDLRSSSQDIMESQMQDLEDDDDPWDDDELQRDAGDDDTMEGVILEKTENLTSMLKNAINSQQAAMATLMERLQQLTEEVATLRSSGGGNAAATSAASDGVVIDDDDIDGGGAGWRPPPPPTRPPSEWDLAAGMGLRSQEPSGANSDFVRLRIRQEPELPQPSPGSFKGHSPMKDMEPTPAAKGDGDGDGDGFTAATVTDGDGGAANGGGGAACEAAAAAAAAPAEVSPPLSPSGMTRMSRVRPKTAPPRRAKPTAVAADMTPGDNPTAATSVPPPPLKAFDENDMDPQIQQHHTTARPNAATSSLPPRYPKLPATADAGRTTAATPASGCRPPDESPSQVASTDGSPRRSSSAGDALRSLQQQMTLDQLLNSSSGPDVLLAAIGTMHEGHGGGGGGAGNDGANPAAKPTPKRHTQEPNPKMSPAPVAVAAAVAPTPSQPPPPPPPPSQQ